KGAPKKVAQSIQSSMSPEDFDKLVNTSLTDAEKAATIAQSMPEKDLAQLIQDQLAPDEKAKMICSQKPDEAAELLMKSLGADEIAKILNDPLVPREEIAKTLIEGLSPSEVSVIVKANMDDDDFLRGITESFSKDDLAKDLLLRMPP